MSLGKQILERLRVLAKAGPEAVGLQSLANDHNTSQLVLDAGDQSVRLELVDYDRFSITFYALEVGNQLPAKIEDKQAVLSSYAAAIARELSYLEEPLAVWELDRSEQLAQLRSCPPMHEDGEVSYWEVTLAVGETHRSARLMRYRWAAGMTDREVVDYPATFALIARLTDSLHAALTTVGSREGGV